MKNPKHSTPKSAQSKMRKTAQFYLNEKTGNVVSYVRAARLGIVNIAKHGFKNPKTGRLVSYQRAKQLGLT